MINDADIEQAQWEQAGAMADAGICVHCEGPLDPLHPKWAASYERSLDRFIGHYGAAEVIRDGRVVRAITPESDASYYGPADESEPFHVRCLPWNREES